MPASLYDLIPRDQPATNDLLLGRFLDYASARKLHLYPAQETAILELFEEKNVILNTPTGSGKSLVATALQFKALAQGRRSIYTCPIKALVNEKWLTLCREFGPDNVGLSTGDASVNSHAPILCCTAEILANIALRRGGQAEVGEVILDEFHYYADRERGVAWQIPLLCLPQARFLLMSATLGETAFFEEELTRVNGRPSVTVLSRDRPVPLDYCYSEIGLAQTLETLVGQGRGPVYVVHFTQLDAAQSAQDFTSINVCSREEKATLAAALEDFKFNSPYGPEIKRWLRQGIGLHHAGLLPKYRVLVEQLAQRGLLKVICGTDTLGVGINVPIRTVLFTRLCKFDGEKTGILTARDFHQIGGRAGRKGYDDRGWVVVQAPEHVVENLKLEEKSAREGKKIVKRKPPERNFVAWDKNTYLRLIAAAPERLSSRFQVTHAMLLNVLSREEDGCAAMRALIARSHETPKAKKAHTKRAWQLFRSLLDRKIVEFIPATDGARHLRVNVDLQDDFSMDQTLSLYLLDTVPLLDPEAPEYPLDLITLVESILEDPEMILRKQLDQLKTQKMAEMRQQGLDYQERIDELEKLEYPKPKREFIYSTFNAFADRHPWIGQENIRPKSIVREMFEQFRSFADYVKIYELQRAEGLLLRHLSRVHKVLVQTVPDKAKTDTVREMETPHSTIGARLANRVAEGTRSACYPEEARMSRPRMVFNRQGFALEATLFVLLLLAVLCVFAVSGVTTTTRTANYDYRNARTAYAAEAASDDIMEQLSGMVDDGFISQTELDSLVRPVVPGFDIPTMTVVPNGGANQETVNDGPFAGLYALVRNYDITTQAADSIGDASRAVVTVKAAAIPIFQFGVFYEKDLEVTNGPRLDFQGWVHSNGNIYIRSANSYYHNIITTPNKYFWRRKDGTTTVDGVFIDDAGGTARRVANDSETLPLAADFQNWSEATFSGRLKTDAYGVDSLRLPLPDGVPPAELLKKRNVADSPEARETKFSWKADWYIDLDYAQINTPCAPGAMTITRLAGRVSPSAAECALIFSGQQDAWWDSREQTFVDRLDVDVAQLFLWMGVDVTRQSSLVFISFRGVPAGLENFTSSRGCPAAPGCNFRPYPMVRVRNASVLGAPFTLATDFPLYIRDNYNTIGWMPSALVGDAVTLLSSSFTDVTHADRPAGVGSTVGGVTRWFRNPAAAQTGITVYAAVLAGHSGTPYDALAGAGAVPAGCVAGGGTAAVGYFYGGGLENFPHFLENWGDPDGGGPLIQPLAFYRGSLVSISFSERATNYCGWGGAFYSPPRRDWAFETRFQDPANLPPGTPVVGSVVQTAYRPVYE